MKLHEPKRKTHPDFLQAMHKSRTKPKDIVSSQVRKKSLLRAFSTACQSISKWHRTLLIDPQLPHNPISPLINHLPIPPILILPPKTRENAPKQEPQLLTIPHSLEQLMSPQSNRLPQPLLHPLLLGLFCRAWLWHPDTESPCRLWIVLEETCVDFHEFRRGSEPASHVECGANYDHIEGLEGDILVDRKKSGISNIGSIYSCLDPFGD